jgi:mRNA-degrading endonuclease toxin of MazEF toxin-antitoxin module
VAARQAITSRLRLRRCSTARCYQSRAIDNRRFVRALRGVPRALLLEVEDKLRRLADL